MKRFLKKLDSAEKSGIINMCLKPISMILSFIYTPLLLSYLGIEKYGLWATLLSIISWINYCDVGIGHGLRNVLSRDIGNKDYNKAKKSVSTAYIMLTIISGIILIFLLILIGNVNWHNIFNTNIDMKKPLAISFIFICINFVLSLINTLLYALQLSERVALRGCIVQLANITGILIISCIYKGSLVLISILFGVSTMIVHIGNTIQLMKKNKFLIPSFGYFDRSIIKKICNTGIKFFIIQIACLMLYTVDSLLITNYFGAESVTPFNIVDKIFNTAFAFLQAFMVPYWSRTTIAIQEREFKWIKKSIMKVNIICGIFCIGYLFLALIFKPLVKIWLGYELDYPTGLVNIMCIYYILYSFVTVSAQFINGTGKINGQVIIMTIMGITNIPLSIFLAVKCGMGVVGIRLATTILMAIAFVYFPINLYFIMKGYEKSYN